MALRILLGDVHGGVKDGNETIMKFQLNAIDAIIDYCIKNNIYNITQLGDLWEVRRATNNNVADKWKRGFYNQLKILDIFMDTLVGNHDAYFKNKIIPNFTSTLLSSYENILIFDEPKEIKWGKTKVAMIPWICKDNYDACMDMINNTDAEVICGHFEIKGARMESGVCEDGLPLETFKRFKLVLSGHFHSQGRYGNVQYIGTPYDTNWAEYGDAKGFWVIDDETLEMEFIRNENPLHIKIVYDEDKDMASIFDEDLMNKYVKVVIENRNDFDKYEAWLTRLETMKMSDLKINEPLLSLDHNNSDIVVDVNDLNVSKTEDMIVQYTNDVYPEKAEKLSKMMLSLHGEARNLS